MSSDDKEAVQIVTNELRIAHERFKSKLSKHQAFLSLCLTFYSSAEKVFQMIFYITCRCDFVPQVLMALA